MRRAAPTDTRSIAVNSRGIVSFVTWQGNNKPGPMRANCGMKAFLDGVTKEIPCPAEG